jgi:hypothetical protein
MKSTNYSVRKLKSRLKEFYKHHPSLGDSDEWYGDKARMTTDCAAQFILWLETGDYTGGIDDLINEELKNE